MISFPSFLSAKAAASKIDKPDWWVEVTTAEPPYVYFFGPFDSNVEADASKDGYIQDLLEEDAQGIVAHVKYCQPQRLGFVDGRTVKP
ncbi:MAG: DUF1816 domain-containing protein [Thermosynechococcaceae cyanobacterium]